jgi:N-acetylneuraminic acid mutarotase
MNGRWRRRGIIGVTAGVFAGAGSVSGQATDFGLQVSTAGSNAVLTWKGLGALQSSPELSGWADVLEAATPHSVPLTNARRFFRVITHWSTRAPLLDANSEMAVAELGGKIYVMGGYPSSRVTVATVQVYDTASNTWSRANPLPTPLNHQMPAAANGRIYVIGGQTDSGSTSFVDTVYEYDPASNNWSTRAPMPTARSSGAAVVLGGLIYVAGGRPPRGQDFAVYNPVANQWTTLPNMPTGRNHLAAAAIDGKVCVVGGRLGAGFTSAMTNVLEIFDPVAGTWSARAPMPTVRGGINGIAVGTRFFVWGGEGPNGMFGQHEMYDSALDRWYRLEFMTVPVHGVTGAAVVNGFIHMPGGGTSTGGSSGSTVHQVFSLAGILPQSELVR